MRQTPYAIDVFDSNASAILAQSKNDSVSACHCKGYKISFGACLDSVLLLAIAAVLKQETLHQNQNEIPIKSVYNLDLSLLQRGTVIDGALLLFWIRHRSRRVLASSMTQSASVFAA